MAKLKVLKNHAFCKELTDPELARLAQCVQEKRFPAKTPIFVETMLSDAMCIVKSGSVRISGKNKDGMDVALNLLESGDSFGCFALFGSGARPLSAYAEEDTELLLIEQDEFQKFEESAPAAALKFYKAVTHHIAAQLMIIIPQLKSYVVNS